VVTGLRGRSKSGKCGASRLSGFATSHFFPEVSLRRNSYATGINTGGKSSTEDGC